MGQGLTWHELAWLVPLLLIVMKCPQVDNHLCVLVDGIVTNAVPERERKRGLGHCPSLPTQSQVSTSRQLGGKEPFTPSFPITHLFLSL